jgi:molecular chaperone GrpE
MAEDEKKPEIPEEEEIVEFEFNENGEEDLKKTLKKLRTDLKQAKIEKEEYLLGWQKERADFANYKKDEEARKTMFSESVRERILVRFLSVMDNFNMAMANRTAWEKVDKSWRMGVEHIYSDLNKIFEEYGVREVGATEEVFDPNIHHSVDMVATDQRELDHKVAEVVQTGYKLGERVLRPAQVKVWEFKEEK